jgi:hypothetical protein
MRTFTLVLLALAATVAGILILFSCGQVDPALAPAGATITLIGPGESTFTYSCHDASGLPIVCYDTWRDYLIAYCRLDLTNNPNQAIEDCLAQGYKNDDCTLLVCENQNYWVNYIEDDDVISEAQANITATPGACGYMNSIISAFVLSAGSSTTGTAATGGTQGSVSAQPMNDIELRFIAEGGEMYKLSDVPGDVPPLSNPYVTKTDERGKAEVKYRTELPTFCGYQNSFTLSADIGVARTFLTLDFVVEESGETLGDDTTDDTTDDTGDDDTGV